MLTDIMLDLETLGTKPGSVILTIAAIEFNINTGETGHDFQTGIDLQDSLNNGFVVNADTLKWWLNTDAQLLTKQISSSISVFSALNLFSQWMFGRTDRRIWGNSNRFDLGLLEAYYEVFLESTPWNFRNERDVRTLVMFAPEVKENMKFEGTEHNPIDDCLYQISYCTEIWKKIHKKE